MANENQIEFNVKIKKDGLSELASDIAKVESEAKDLATSSVTAGAGLEKLEQEAHDKDFHLLIKPVVPNKLRAMIAFKLDARSAALSPPNRSP